MLPDVPSTRPTASICLAAARISSGVVLGDGFGAGVASAGSAMGTDLRVGQVGGHVPAEEGGEALGHERGVVGLGVVGGAADVGGEQHVVHRGEWVVDAEV